MSKSVYLYLASGVSSGIGFWMINFTENVDIINPLEAKLLECYRKELFGIDAAIEVKKAITDTLDILLRDFRNDGFKIENPNEGYSSEIPLNVIEDIFDLWVYNFPNDFLWKKYIGLLSLRQKLTINNSFINKGLKGNTYQFAMKLEKILSYRPVKSSININQPNKLMW